MIDMRLRPPLPSWRNARLYSVSAFSAFAHPDFPRSPSAATQEIGDLLSEMDAAGIETGVIMGRQSPGPLGSLPNGEIEAFIAAHGERFAAWAGLDVTQPMEEVLAELERCVATGIYSGASIEPTLSDGFAHAGDRKLYPLFEALQKHELPINISLSCALQIGAGQDLDKARPGHLIQASKDFPDLVFHIAHAAWPFTLEAIALAISRPNVWLSPDMYLVPQFPGAADFAHAARHYLGRRTLFGTAYPFKPLRPTVDGYLSWGWPRETQNAVLRDNARRLLKLD